MEKSRYFINYIDISLGTTLGEYGYQIKNDYKVEEIGGAKGCVLNGCGRMILHKLNDYLFMQFCNEETINLSDIPLIVGTQFSSINEVRSFDEVSLIKGALAVNPSNFPDTVLNAPASQVSIYKKMHGDVITIMNGISSTLDAIGMARIFLDSSDNEAAIIIGVDEVGEIQRRAYSEDKKLVESVGICVLRKGNYDESHRKNSMEIISYGKESILTDSKVDYDKISQIILRTAYHQRVVLFFESDLPNSTNMEIIDLIYSSTNITEIYYDIDNMYMGMTGLVEIFKYQNMHDPCSIGLILNIEGGQITSMILAYM